MPCLDLAWEAELLLLASVMASDYLFWPVFADGSAYLISLVPDFDDWRLRCLERFSAAHLYWPVFQRRNAAVAKAAVAASALGAVLVQAGNVVVEQPPVAVVAGQQVACGAAALAFVAATETWLQRAFVRFHLREWTVLKKPTVRTELNMLYCNADGGTSLAPISLTRIRMGRGALT